MLLDFFRQVIAQPDPCLPFVCRVQQYEADQQRSFVLLQVFRRKVVALRRAAVRKRLCEIRKVVILDVIIVVPENANEIPLPVFFLIASDLVQIVDSLCIEKQDLEIPPVVIHLIKGRFLQARLIQKP